MKNAVKLYGGIIGSAIVIPATIVAVAGFTLATAFSKGFGGGSGSQGYEIGLILGVLAMVLSMAAPAFTAINFVKPENEFRKVSAILVVLAGFMALAYVIYTLTKNFSVIQLVVLAGALGVFASGLLQLKD